MKKLILSIWLALSIPVVAQVYQQAINSVNTDLENSIQRLENISHRISEEKIELSRNLEQLRSKVILLRREFEQSDRINENKKISISQLENEIKIRQNEIDYLNGLLSDYVRHFDSQLHIAEIQRYSNSEDLAINSIESNDLNFASKISVIMNAIDRLKDSLGGISFKGHALATDNVLENGTIGLLGPIAIFSSDESSATGIIVEKRNSLEPSIYENIGDENQLLINTLLSEYSGNLPIDTTLGNALKIEAVKETPIEHIQKGGIVIYFILVLALFAFLIALYKWFEISGIKKSDPEDIKKILEFIDNDNSTEAINVARKIKGPIGVMLIKAVENIDSGNEVLEEMLQEQLLLAQPKLERLIPFIAVTAATAPLLGLLGTVTGMIKTFKIITEFGTGDAKSLSAGISEALITTEFGLFVAIPALIVHALLLRRSKSVLASMEQSAVAFINGNSVRSSENV